MLVFVLKFALRLTAANLSTNGMRIQKYFSEKGILSRRETERAILAGRVSVNGIVVRELGTQIDSERDKVLLIGQPSGGEEKKITVAVYKPRGVVSADSSGEGRTIFDLLPQFKHLNCVGRLDKESEGLLLLSNDGVITRAVTGDEHKIEKEYEVKVRETLRPNMLRKMAEGILLADGRTLPAKAEMLESRIFKITLREGRKHQIRRMCAELKLTVESLKRTRVGNITLKNLRRGQFRELEEKEVAQLKKLAA